jgi:histidinol-phosphate/aromatic aminotransferase/cobyric acid decarboxylase-like protein
MNLELFFVKPAISAKAKAQTENVRFQGEINLKQIQQTIAERKGFKLSGISVWAGSGEIQDELVSNTVELAKRVGITNPLWTKREVECSDKRSGEPFMREVLRVKQGLTFTF